MTTDRSPSSSLAAEPFDEDEERELRGLWLSRLMFNPFVGWPEETRTFEEFLEANRG